uniref:Uncharacterized protein n=1 Tax=Anguilla anguilla TaxID=7936 RepID=A0A0E9TPA6_ANGAN
MSCVITLKTLLHVHSSVTLACIFSVWRKLIGFC